MRYIFALLIFFFSHFPGWAQNDKVMFEILRMLGIGCDFQKRDSGYEFSFGINVYVDIVSGKVDSMTVTGVLPTACNLSRPEYLARENRFLIKYLNDKKINWKSWLTSYGYGGCKRARLVFPHIFYINDLKSKPGSTFYNDFIEPFYATRLTPGPCTVIFKPVITGPNYSVN